jgi:hypothetical protein
MRMKARLHLFAIALFVLTLFYNLYLWGGLARTPELGPLMTQATQREVSLAGIYLPLGRILIDAAGLKQTAASFAETRFAGVRSRVLANPAAAMDTILSDLPASVSLAYYGAPLLLPLAALLWWRRPRGVHMIRRG